MDHTMPCMDGLTTVRQIKNSPATASIPVAMYTSKDEPSYQDEAQAAGAVGVLSKPAIPRPSGRFSNSLTCCSMPPISLAQLAGTGLRQRRSPKA